MFDGLGSQAMLAFPEKSSGCSLKVHYLNQHYPEVNERSLSASPSSSRLPSDADYYLEFYDVAGPMTWGLKTTKDKKRLNLSSRQSQLQASILKVYLAEKFDGAIICFDLNNMKSLLSLPTYFAIIDNLVN